MNNTANKIDTTSAVDTSHCAAATSAIRIEAAKLLSEGTVTAVVGYKEGRRQGHTLPAIVTDPARARELIFSPACVNNLALYLTKAKKGVVGPGKIAIVAKGPVLLPLPAQ